MAAHYRGAGAIVKNDRAGVRWNLEEPTSAGGIKRGHSKQVTFLLRLQDEWKPTR